VAADQDQTLVIIFQPPGVGLGEGLPRRGHVDGVDPFPRLLADVLPAAVEGIGLHHRPPAAAVGVVVHLLLLIHGVVPNLVAVHPDIAPLLPPAQHGLTEHISHHIGE